MYHFCYCAVGFDHVDACGQVGYIDAVGIGGVGYFGAVDVIYTYGTSGSREVEHVCHRVRVEGESLLGGGFGYVGRVFGYHYLVSLSKTSLPGVRTGIVVAAPEVIRAIGSLNAITNLDPTRFGAAIAAPLIESGKLQQLSADEIQPFYQKQADLAVSILKKHFSGSLKERLLIHQPEDTIFL